MGWIKYWIRLNVGMSMNMQGYRQMFGRPGESDLLAFVQCDETCWVLLLEVKREDGGIQSPAQQQFEHRFLGLHNVIYALITDHKQIKDIVHNIRIKSKSYGKLEDWELPKDI